MKDLSIYLNIPFLDMGRDWKGCDCWGLVRLFLKNEFGVEVDSFANLFRDLKDIESIRLIAENEKKRWIKVEGKKKVGDVVEIPLTPNNFHVGVIAAPGKILHIEKGGCSGLTDESSRMIKHRIKGYWRHVSLER